MSFSFFFAAWRSSFVLSGFRWRRTAAKDGENKNTEKENVRERERDGETRKECIKREKERRHTQKKTRTDREYSDILLSRVDYWFPIFFFFVNCFLFSCELECVTGNGQSVALLCSRARVCVVLISLTFFVLTHGSKDEGKDGPLETNKKKPKKTERKEQQRQQRQQQPRRSEPRVSFVVWFFFVLRLDRRLR